MMFSNKNLSILIILLFITSQAVAYSSKVCDMETSGTDMSMSNMDHSGHNMDATSTDSKTDTEKNKDCCDDSCDCSMGGCSSTFISNTSNKNIDPSRNSKSTKSKDRFISSIERSSLYRPPIAS